MLRSRGEVLLCLGNRIETAGVVGMASQQAPNRQPQAAAKPVALDRLQGVV